MKFVVRSAVLDKALREAPRKVAPYAFAALRRSFAAYRREFNKSLSSKLKRTRGFSIPTSGRKGASWGFHWVQKPASGGKKRGYANEKKEMDPKSIHVAFYTTSKVAEALEFGAVIRPRKKRMLAIPMGFALSKSGKVKSAFRQPSTVKGGWRRTRDGKKKKGKAKELTFIKAKNGKAFLALRLRGKTPSGKPRLRVVFRLVPQVRIRARLGFYAGWDRFGPQKQKRLKSEMDRYMREVWGQGSKRSAA